MYCGIILCDVVCSCGLGWCGVWLVVLGCDLVRGF